MEIPKTQFKNEKLRGIYLWYIIIEILITAFFLTLSHDLYTVPEKQPLFPGNTFAMWFLPHCERKYAICIS